MWPAEPKLPGVHDFVLAGDFICTLCWNRSSGWGQLWSVPFLETTWQTSATTSTSWWKSVCPGLMAELSLLELQWLLKTRWFPAAAPTLVVLAPCSARYHCLVRTKLLSVTSLETGKKCFSLSQGKNILKQPGNHCCAYTICITSFPNG